MAEETQKSPKETKSRDGRGGHGGKDRGGRRDRGGAHGSDDGEGHELRERLVAVNRVSKTVKGGRRMGFAAIMVVGDGRGRIGAGAGKAREVPEAIKKATDQAKRAMIRVPLRDGRTIHHDVEARFGAGRVRLRAAPAGTGVIAGGPLRAVFEVLGISDIVAKSLGSSNPYNMVKAALAAFATMESPRSVAGRRGRRVNEVLGKKADAKETA